MPLADPKPAGEQASGSGLAKLGPTKEIPVAFCQVVERNSRMVQLLARNAVSYTHLTLPTILRV